MGPRWVPARVASLVVAGSLVAACGGGNERAGGQTAPTRSTAPPAPATATPTAPPTAPTVPPTTPSPTFASDVAPVTAADLGPSWRSGCPVGPDQLRRVGLSYWDFDGAARTGALVVHAAVADAVVGIFRTLFEQRFPIRRMETIDRFAGDDDASMAADNTSAFNCRLAVTTGPPVWSSHAYGRAIDVNPVENPYLLAGEVLPPAGAPYADRTDVRPGMAVDGGPLVAAFAAAGWEWGGRWTASPDYQHFSTPGR